jgi:hypothetical protein
MGKKSRKILALSLLMILFMSFAGPALPVCASEASGAEYQVQRNDNLYKIAREQLGSGARWTEIYELNKEIIKDPAIIYSSQILKLPGIESSVAVANEEAALSEQQEADKYAKELVDAASLKEPEITAVLKSLESDNAHLEGLEYRLKSLESTSRKILLDAHDMEISIQEASQILSDILRYTYVIEDASYVATTRLIIDTLVAGGYAVKKYKNYWINKDNAYQGINVQFISKEGIIFELQFHTPISYYTKNEKTHGYYEIMRSETASEQEKAQAEALQNAAFAEIPVPEGVESLVY